MKTHKLAIVPGDGIGPEVIAQGMRILRKIEDLGFCRFETTAYPWGAQHYLDTGRAAPEDIADVISFLLGPDARYVPAPGPHREVLLSKFDLNRMPARPGVRLECNEILMTQFPDDLLCGAQRALRAGRREDVAARPPRQVAQAEKLGAERSAMLVDRRNSIGPATGSNASASSVGTPGFTI